MSQQANQANVEANVEAPDEIVAEMLYLLGWLDESPEADEAEVIGSLKD